MSYATTVANSLGKSVVTHCTTPGRRGSGCTSSVRPLGAGLLALALAAGSPGVQAGRANAVDRADLERAQAAGWLELRRDQARYRQQIGAAGVVPSPEVRQDLGILERQEDLDRRALDQREARWLEDARRRDRLVEQGALTTQQGPTLRLRVEQAEANERLRRDLRRQTLPPSLPMAPILTPPPFRLR